MSDIVTEAQVLSNGMSAAESRRVIALTIEGQKRRITHGWLDKPWWECVEPNHRDEAKELLNKFNGIFKCQTS